MKKQILISLILASSILSLNAQNWSGITPGKIYYNLGNVGIGEVNPDQKLNITQTEDISTADQYRFPLKLVLNDNAGGLWQGTGVGMKFHINASDANFDSAEILSIAKTAGIRNGDLTFRTSKAGVLSTHLTINSDGNVGIGTATPSRLLTIRKDVANGIGAGIMLMNNQYSGNNGAETEIIFSNYTESDNPFRYFKIHNVGANQYGVPDRLSFGSSDISSSTYQDWLTIKSSGNIGIGTTSPSCKLDVCGTIRANEVKVDLAGGCDFVFKKNYKLMNLNELEKFVTTKEHLPEIASEKEMIKNGLNMKDFQMKLLQKMEEMTLYIIEQNKKNEKQEHELKILKNEIKKMKAAKNKN